MTSGAERVSLALPHKLPSNAAERLVHTVDAAPLGLLDARMAKVRVADFQRSVDGTCPADLAMLQVDGLPPARHLAHLGGRLCARAALHDLTGRGDSVGRTEAGVPVWPIGVVGSISHNETITACAVADECHVELMWIDLDQVVDGAAAGDIASVCLTVCGRDELAASRCRAEDAPPRFCAKGAYYKAVHPRIGRFVEFEEAEVRATNWPNGRFEIGPCAGDREVPATCSCSRAESAWGPRHYWPWCRRRAID